MAKRTPRPASRRGKQRQTELAQLLAAALAEPKRRKRAAWRGAGTVAGQVWWHWRRQLAPLAAMAAVYLAGLVVIGLKPTGVVVLGVAAAGLVGVVGHRRGVRRVELVWAAGCVLVATGWLAAAAAVGTGRPMPALLIALGAAGGAPWWYRWRDRGTPGTGPTGTVARWAERVAVPDGPLPGSTLENLTPIRNGEAADVLLRAGKDTTGDAIDAAPRIASAYESAITSVIVTPAPGGAQDRARCMWLRSSQVDRVQPWTGPSLDPATGLALFGPYADDGMAMVRFWRPGSGATHCLITGCTEGGKSRCVDWTVAEAAYSGLIATWIGDPQGGQSLPEWRGRVHAFADGPEATVMMLDEAVRELDARSAYLSTLEWVDEQGRPRAGKAFFDPTPELPLLQVVIDEAQDILDAGSAAVKLCERIVRKGRKCGVRLVPCTHVPSVDQLGGSMTLRAQLASGNVICLRTAEHVTKGMVLPRSFPVDPYSIPTETAAGETTAGTAFVYGPQPRPVPARGHYVADVFGVAAAAPLIPLRLLSVDRALVAAGRRDDRDPAAASDAAEEQQAATMAEQLITLVGRYGVMDRPQMFAELPRGTSPRTVAAALTSLVKSGKLERVSKGQYRLPDAAAA